MPKRYRDAGCFHDVSHLDDDKRERQTSRTRTKTRSALKALEHRNARRTTVFTWTKEDSE